MSRLMDPERLRHYRTALKFWQTNGYITFTDRAAGWVRAHLGIDPRELRELMYNHVARGGEIDEVKEQRENWKAKYEYHYDLRLTLESGRKIYIETRLQMETDPEDSTIAVVNVHDQ